MEKSIHVNLDPALAGLGVSVVFMLAQGKLSLDATTILAKHWQDAQTAFKMNHTFPSVLNHPHLQAYRALHSSLGINDSTVVPSPESLIRVLFDARSLQPIGPVVDLYNAVSLQHLVSIGAHDAEKLGQSITLAMNSSEIRFRPLGQKKKLSLPANEYSYQTDDGRAICRLECKQANETKLRPETNSWLFIVQGNENIGLQTLTTVSESLTKSLETHLEALSLSVTTLHEANLFGRIALTV